MAGIGKLGPKIKNWVSISVEIGPELSGQLITVSDKLNWSKSKIARWCLEKCLPELEKRAASIENCLSEPIDLGLDK